MRNTTMSFVEVLKEECKSLSSKGLPVSLNDGIVEKYIDDCSQTYDLYRLRFMTSGVTSLDRHKIASILVLEAIANDLIKTDESIIPEGMISIGQEKVVIRCALYYIQREFNQLIEGHSFEKMDRFILPTAFSPQTKYIDTMCRIQLHSKKFYNKTEYLQIALMDLADRFFLLEYISILLFYGEKKADEVFEFLHSLHDH